jgi:hypothetical protein
MFGTSPSTFGSATFINYCADDGTIGYFSACNRQDNADAYVYLIANEGAWNGGGAGGGGDNFYLTRVARAKLSRLQPTDYQFFTGGDGSLDSSWTSNQTGAVSILANKGKLGEPAVQYIPSLNRYLLLTFYYPEGLAPKGGTAANSVWLSYESPHPWGPWTLINTMTWTGPGYYNPIPIACYSGLTCQTIFTGDFQDGGTANYQPYLSTMTILH